MYPTDMHMLEFYTSGSYQLTDTWCTSYNAPSLDSNMGGKNDLVNVTYYRTSNGDPAVTYLRALNTGDKYDKVLAVDVSQSLIIAWGSGKAHDHGGNYKKTSIIISKTAVVTDTSAGFNYWDLHGISLVILWSVFNFIGYISARFLKHYSWWIWGHRIGSGLTSMWTIGMAASAFSQCIILLKFFSQ